MLRFRGHKDYVIFMWKQIVLFWATVVNPNQSSARASALNHLGLEKILELPWLIQTDNLIFKSSYLLCWNASTFGYSNTVVEIWDVLFSVGLCLPGKNKSSLDHSPMKV